MQERTIAIWKKEDKGWSAHTFLEEHQKYKRNWDEREFYFWETILYVAEQLGMDENEVEKLLEDQQGLSIVDLLFGMFLHKLYGSEFAGLYLKSEKTLAFAKIHQLIREAEGYLIDQEEEADQAMKQKLKEVSKSIEESSGSNEAAQEAFVQYAEKMVKIMEEVLAKEKEHQKEAKPEIVAADKVPEKEELKQSQKLEVENRVLKYQLEHKEEVAQIQLQLSEKEGEIKRLQSMLQEAQEKYAQLQKEKEGEIAELQSTCADQKKAFEELHRRVERMTEAYQLVVEANTKQFERVVPLNIFKWKK